MAWIMAFSTGWLCGSASLWAWFTWSLLIRSFEEWQQANDRAQNYDGSQARRKDEPS